MYVQANTEVTTRYAVQGYATPGARSGALDPAEGLMIDVEAVYEIDEDGKPYKVNLVHSLTANQMEQVEAALHDAWTDANG